MLTVCFVCAAVAEMESLMLKVTLDEESIAVGENVTATYEVGGGTGKYNQRHTWRTIESAGGMLMPRTGALILLRRDFASGFRRSVRLRSSGKRLRFWKICRRLVISACRWDS